MKKLKLDPGSLSVQGFETAPAAPARGTVQALARGVCTALASCPCDTGQWACGPFTNQSCDYTRAGNTCDSFPTEVDPTCICA
ncbi:hypothetical protein [Longimicrobium sp.]|uniref:hypothetical protein n=1 Tax=Longimicrobium sp. TaxID=2029185 RepID=UPI002CED2186|nr:hypothetical protein [Longimicrobium sp.]HSU15094.1 hypothetical protein [Longimicrobium sp.]